MQDQYNHDRLVLDLIRRDRLPKHALFDTPHPWIRFWALALMVLMTSVSLYLLLSTNQMFGRIQGSLVGIEDNDTQRIRQYNEKLQSLQDRMTVFVADSVENKLLALERNVSSGTVGSQEIKTLEELKGEVKLLENYSSGRHANLTDPTRLDHPRFQIIPGSQTIPDSGELFYEVSQMKRLLYISIASCGFMGFMLGGYWWHSHSRIKRLVNEMPRTPLLARTMEEDL